jgi:hypothetical protein
MTPQDASVAPRDASMTPRDTSATPRDTSVPSANGSYLVFGSFQGSDPGCPVGATYLLPPSYIYKAQSEFSVRLLYTGPQDYKQQGYANSDFALSFSLLNGNAPVEQANVVSTVVAGPAIWACQLQARAKLRASFLDLLQNVEALELKGTLIPGAWRRIGQALADTIPAPPLETLFYRCALSPGLEAGTLPFVDVQPGMRLRVDAQASQFLAPSSTQNGYVPAGAPRLTIASAPGPGSERVLAFDPFLSTIRSPTIAGAGAVPAAAAGVVDLEPLGGARAHWRLFYPQSIAPPAQPGDLSIADNVTLLGAPTRAALETATGQYPTPVTGGTPPNVYVVFQGRATIVPEIPIWTSMNGPSTIEWVPLGSTIASIVERYTSLPLDPVSYKNVVSVRRVTGAVAGGSAPVTPWTQGLVAVPPALFEVPLIAGDTITVTARPDTVTVAARPDTGR